MAAKKKNVSGEAASPRKSTGPRKAPQPGGIIILDASIPFSTGGRRSFYENELLKLQAATENAENPELVCLSFSTDVRHQIKARAEQMGLSVEFTKNGGAWLVRIAPASEESYSHLGPPSKELFEESADVKGTV